MRGHLPYGFRRVFRREVRQLADQPAFAFMLGPYPFLLFLLLASVFSAGLPTGLPVAVVDQDGSAFSRQAVQMIDQTPEIVVAARLPNLSEARQELLAGKVYGIILIPEFAERDLLLGEQPEIVTFYNNQMLTIGGIVSRAASTALGTLSAGVSIQLREAQGQSAEEAKAAVNPIPVQQSPLFNPALDYTQFLLASVMPTVLQIFICASAVLAISRDRHSRGSLPRLVRLGGSPFRALAGKLAPYAIAYLVTLFLADGIIFGYFGAPFRGSIPMHVIYTVIFVMTCLALGALIGLIARETVSGLGVVGVLTAPAFGFAGISFPRFAMNGFSQLWDDIIPLTPYLQLRTDQAVRGAPEAVSMPTLGWLALLLIIYGGAALLLMSRQARATKTDSIEMQEEAI